MKLRFRGQSLRLRLTRGEVSNLVEIGFVEERVQIGADPHAVLRYRIELSDQVKALTARFIDSQICVRLPVSKGRQWFRDDAVGIYGETAWGLKLIVEKDFKCLDPNVEEDQTDAFENPGGNHCESVV